MEVPARKVNGTLYKQQLRAGTVVTSSFLRKQPGLVVFALQNTHDQSMSVQFQGAMDKDASIWFPVGAAIALAAGNVTAATDTESLTDPWKFIRIQVTPGGVPTVGELDVLWGWEGVPS